MTALVMRPAMEKELDLSPVLKIARTIADLAGAADITTAHVSEPIQYRSLDRKKEFA